MYDLSLKVREVIARSAHTRSVRLTAPEDIRYEAGQFMQVCLPGEQACRRYLSLSSSPTEKGYIEFTKKLTGSDFSNALRSLKAGDEIKVQFPYGKFTLQDPRAKVAFLSGGIGITPIRSIIKYAVDANLGTDMVLVYANRSIEEIVFKDDFDQMQRRYPKLKVAHVLCEPAPNFTCTVGFINGQVIKNEVPDYLQRKFYLCGPPGMVDAMKKILGEELALPKESIVTENFTGY